MGKTRIEEHRAFLAWLVQLLEDRQPDALLVSGDLFDHGLPPHDVQGLYYQSLVQLQATGCRNIILCAGNHDSVSFLEASRSLCEKLGIRIFSHLRADASEHFVPIYGKDELVLGNVLAMPYLRERELRAMSSAESIACRRPALLQGLANLFKRPEASKALPCVAMGHFYAVGSSLSDSERELYLGELEAVPIEILGDWDYFALGHLHRAQKVGSKGQAWYSGTPFAMNFNDAHRQQCVLEVEVEVGQLPVVEKIAIPRFRPMVSLHCASESLETELAALSFETGERTWMELWLNEPKPWDWIQATIECVLKDKPVEVLSVRFENVERERQVQAPELESLDLLSPKTLFETHLKSCDFSPEINEQLLKHFDEVLAALAEEGLGS